MTKKEVNNDEVIDLRSRVEVKPKPTPVKISSDFERVPKVKAGIGKTMMVILFLLAGVSLIAGWVFLSNPKKTTETSLKVVVDAPRTVVAGEPFNIKINYENIDVAVLKNMQLTIEHPELWHLQTAETMPVDENQSLWKLDDLAVSSTKELNLTGVIYGEKKQENNFEIKFNYQPENFSSQFEDKVGFKILLSDGYFSQIKGMPNEINIDDNKIIELDYTFGGEQDSGLIDFELSLPEGVKIASSTPMAVNNVWRFDTWKKGEEKNIKLILTSDRETTGQAIMVAKKDNLKVGSWTNDVKILAPNLFLSIERIGGGNVNFGSSVNIQLKISNNGTSDFVVDNVKTLITSDLIDWDKVVIKDAEVKEREIIWTAGKGDFGKKIKTIKAGEQKTVDFVLPILAKQDVASVANSSLIKISSVALINNGNEQKNINGSGLELSVINPFTVSAIGRYYATADNPVGSGPLPPQIGKKTTYQIVWTIMSGGDNLKDLKFTATLPDYVTWEGQDEEISGGGNIDYSSAGRKISWELSKLNNNQQMSVAFLVSVLPVESQLGQIMVLSNAANFNAKNETTGSTINNMLSIITSELPDDEIASGKGRVRAE